MYRLVWFGLKMKQTQFERKTKCSSKETCFGANDDDDSSKYRRTCCNSVFLFKRIVNCEREYCFVLGNKLKIKALGW